ncbi:DUF6479 family protein [Streptomyces sp. KMM 9044]|uniref:DUF6479 family protein n=1 Tax=Streptomyces sp. KMM 9044 TaxID=2744474 RepID=UPI0021518871|nr:DUF6479 family protein [Streptomyces sp. KMM 9044]WAX81512.1 DUF6479 family protein [Streptomyces sp. KMM 9044]
MTNTATDTPWMEAADLAASRGVMGVGLVVAAVLVVGMLIGLFAFGSKRVKEGDSPRPRPDEQPRMPEGGPVREVREHREPDEIPRSDDRLTPHDLHGGNSGSRPGTSQERPRWEEGGSGAFGSGGPGRR